MPDPVSYLLVERGWDVVAKDGSHLGHIEDVVADEAKDIFNGIVVTAGLFRATKYVPSERVAEIVEGRVALDLDSDAFAQLDEHDAT
jgi:uncharacterized protein YrrD